MDKCKKYRIQEWLVGYTFVYTPQKKESFLFIDYWTDLVPRTHFFSFIIGERGFCGDEAEAKRIIEQDKEKDKLIKEWSEKKEEAEKSYKGKRNICVD